MIGALLRAQSDGEGVFALYGVPHGDKKRGITSLLWSLMLGAGLLFGDESVERGAWLPHFFGRCGCNCHCAPSPARPRDYVVLKSGSCRHN